MDLKTILIASVLRFPAIHFIMLGLESRGVGVLGSAVIAFAAIVLSDCAVAIAKKL